MLAISDDNVVGAIPINLAACGATALPSSRAAFGRTGGTERGEEKQLLDELDAELLCRLDRNARATVSDLASQIGVARNTVQARLRRLLKDGVVSRFQPVVDLNRLGLTSHALISLRFEPSLLGDVTQMLAGLPFVLEVVTTKDEVALVRVATSSEHEMEAMREYVGRMPGVRDASVIRIVGTPVPYRTVPLLRLLTRRSGWGRSTPLPT